MTEITKNCHNYAAYYAELFSTPCIVMDTESMTLDTVLQGTKRASQAGYTAKSKLPDVSKKNFCAYCNHCNVVHTHLFGSHEAFRWDGKYIYYCQLGLVFIASSISGVDGVMTNSLVLGPIVMGEPLDTIDDISAKSLKKSVESLTHMPTSQVNNIAEILRSTTGFISSVPHSYAGAFVIEQDKMLKSLYSARNQYIDTTDEAQYTQYYIDSEKRLKNLIKNRDKQKAQELLNDMLGFIYFHNNFNFEHIKARVMELIVVISRATIDAGANISEILLYNENFLTQLDSLETTEELSFWISAIMHRFINYTFDFAEIKHANVIHKVMSYVNMNYDNKISLDDIAKHVYLSRTYLSSIFREGTGKGLFAYINEVRIEKSKMFLRDSSIKLADVAMLCGFEDQSYFTKVFKKSVGVSPKKFRDSKGYSAKSI